MDKKVRNKYFKLVNNKVVPCKDVFEWATWYETADEKRIIMRTELENDVLVSTVFLGINYNHFTHGLPILFETMVFEGKEDGLEKRYCTLEEAKKGHEEIVRSLEDQPPPLPPFPEPGQRLDENYWKEKGEKL